MSKIDNLENMINGYKSGVYNYTDHGKCIECGNCCSRYLAMNQKEINTIKAYIKRKGITQQKHSINVLSTRLDRLYVVNLSAINGMR